MLAPRDLGGYVAIDAARRGEGQIAGNKCRALLPELEPSSFRSQPSNLEFGEKLMNSFLASHEPSVVELNDRVRLKQGGHATDVTCVLSNDQLPLQFLGIVDRFSSGWITHNDTLPNVVDSTAFIVFKTQTSDGRWQPTFQKAGR